MTIVAPEDMTFDKLIDGLGGSPEAETVVDESQKTDGASDDEANDDDVPSPSVPRDEIPTVPVRPRHHAD